MGEPNSIESMVWGKIDLNTTLFSIQVEIFQKISFQFIKKDIYLKIWEHPLQYKDFI